MSAVSPDDEPGDGGGEPADVDEEKVGYKRPPKQHRFQPGKSGNPNGRKKGAIGIKRALAEELGSTVKVTIDRDGARKTVALSKLQYIVKLLVEKALKGDRRSIEQLITLNMTIFGLGEDDGAEDAQLTPGEQAYLDALAQRHPLGDAEAGHKADLSFIASGGEDVEDQTDD